MGQAVEQGGGHFGIAEDCGPFAEAEVSGDGHACFLIELAQQMEQQGAARSTEWQVSQFVEDHEIELGQVFGNLPGLALGLFLLEGVDQLDRGEEADLSAMMFDGLDAKGGGDMILYR